MIKKYTQYAAYVYNPTEKVWLPLLQGSYIGSESVMPHLYSTESATKAAITRSIRLAGYYHSNTHPYAEHRHHYTIRRVDVAVDFGDMT